jgi:hypothetical protein
MSKISQVAENIVKNLLTKQRLLLHLKLELVDMNQGSLRLKLPYS